MTCPLCGNLGLAEHANGEIAACHCPAGAVVRTRSNLETIQAPAFKTVAERLRNVGYSEPTLRPLPKCTVANCDQLAPLGGMCDDCEDEVNAYVVDDKALVYALLFGLVAGLPIYFAVFKLLGWVKP